jgi:hypothetical protein
VNDVACPLVDHELRIGNRGQKALLVLPWDEPIPFAPDDERGYGDRTRIGRPAAMGPASVCFQTRAGTFRLSSTITSRTSCGTRSELVPTTNSRTNEESTGSVRACTVSTKSNDGYPLGEAPWRSDENEPADALGFLDRKLLDGEDCAGRGNECGPLDLEQVKQGEQVSSEVTDAVARLRRVAVTALRRRDGATA